MKKESIHDPVSAISEAEATGETAAIFADIRETMQIPLLTSIWRTLAGVEDGLEAVWKITKPLYSSGRPAAALKRLQEEISFPVPKPLAPGQLECAGVTAEDLPVIRTIIDAYNRSNGMNLFALTALAVEPAGTLSQSPVTQTPIPWPALPPLLAQSDMLAATWTLIHQLNQFGAQPDEPGLATLWRHLALWPGFLAVVHAGFSPLQQDRTIARSIEHTLKFAQEEGARLASELPEDLAIPETARNMVAKYVRHPGLVVRMVAIGQGLARWLRRGL